MALSSKQFIRARISRAKFRQLLRLFALDLTATQISALTDLNRNTVNRYLTLIGQAVAAHCERESPFSGDVESVSGDTMFLTATLKLHCQRIASSHH
jgi:transposase